MMETIQVQGELLFVLTSKEDWINKVPRILPKRKYSNEVWLWLDKNGNIFLNGADFSIAEEKMLFPCRVYRIPKIAEIYKPL